MKLSYEGHTEEKEGREDQRANSVSHSERDDTEVETHKREGTRSFRRREEHCFCKDNSVCIGPEARLKFFILVTGSRLACL